MVFPFYEIGFLEDELDIIFSGISVLVSGISVLLDDISVFLIESLLPLNNTTLLYFVTLLFFKLMHCPLCKK